MVAQWVQGFRNRSAFAVAMVTMRTRTKSRGWQACDATVPAVGSGQVCASAFSGSHWRCTCSRARPRSWDTFFSKVFVFQESLVAAQDFARGGVPGLKDHDVPALDVLVSCCCARTAYWPSSQSCPQAQIDCTFALSGCKTASVACRSRSARRGCTRGLPDPKPVRNFCRLPLPGQQCSGPGDTCIRLELWASWLEGAA